MPTRMRSPGAPRPPVWRAIVLCAPAACLASLGCGGGAGRLATEPADGTRAAATSPGAAASPESASVASAAATGSPASPAPPRGERSGVYHTLEAGQTLYAIARSYGVPLETLLRVNRIADPSRLPDGLPIFIPGAPRRLEVAPTFTPAAGPPDPSRTEARDPGPPRGAPGSLNASLLSLPSVGGGTAGPGAAPGPPGGGPGSPPEVRPRAPRAPAAPRGGFERVPARPSLPALDWPLRGAITSGFGRQRRRHAHHEGIDIDGEDGEPILAAAAGTVVRAGRDGGYGRCVVLDHGRGLATLYAHASRLLVEEGDRVEAGQEIAEVGESGNARGSHLHFEVHREGRAVNPLPYLRAARAGRPRVLGPEVVPAQRLDVPRGPIGRPSPAAPRPGVPK